jgi:release factor glutamine methyltransferase
LQIRELFRNEMGLTRTDLMGIVSHVLDLSNERLLMEPARRLDERDWDRIKDLIGERLKGKPLAYLTHRKEFFSETFYVDERVLIPRPETELLVEEALSIIGSPGGAARVLDMGTGSGIIGILLAKKGVQRVLSVDVSAGALEVAQRNARALSVDDRIDFAASDLFSSVRQDAIFDLVCANLPYVGLVEWDGLMADVRCFEPKEALLGGTRGFELYARFIPEASAYLRPGGCVLCEIGGEVQARVVGDLLKDAGFEVGVKHDLAGRQRVVSGTWTSLS